MDALEGRTLESSGHHLNIFINRCLFIYGKKKEKKKKKLGVKSIVYTLHILSSSQTEMFNAIKEKEKRKKGKRNERM